MAYTANEFLVIVEGTIASSEIWSNTWCVLDTVGGQDRQVAVNIVHSFYNAILGALSDQCIGLTATTRELSTSVSTPRAWDDTPGSLSADLLPTECAVRVSLNDRNNHRGGPFLCGFTISSVESDGRLLELHQVLLADEVQDLAQNLLGLGWQLRINRPSVGNTVVALEGKVGEVFDVIRKRRNDIPESYLVRDLF